MKHIGIQILCLGLMSSVIFGCGVEKNTLTKTDEKQLPGPSPVFLGEVMSAEAAIIPRQWKVVEFHRENAINLGDEVDPQIKGRFKAVICRTMDTYEQDRYLAEPGSSKNSYLVVKRIGEEGSVANLYGTYISERKADSWFTVFELENDPIGRGGKPVDSFDKRVTEVIVAGSKRETEFRKWHEKETNRIQEENRLEQARRADEERRVIEERQRMIAAKKAAAEARQEKEIAARRDFFSKVGLDRPYRGKATSMANSDKHYDMVLKFTKLDAETGLVEGQVTVSGHAHHVIRHFKGSLQDRSLNFVDQKDLKDSSRSWGYCSYELNLDESSTKLVGVWRQSNNYASIQLAANTK